MLYVLLLENNKFYVGYTNRPNGERFLEHFTDNGAMWTKTHKPIEVVYFGEGNLEDEDHLTLEMMKKYGWWNVRGGHWCNVKMTTPPEELMPKLPPTLQEMSTIKESEDMYNCQRCGRTGHTTGDCYATTHKNGQNLENKKQYKPNSKNTRNSTTIEELDLDIDYVVINSNDKNICQKCGRTGHSHDQCYAKTHIEGHYIIKPKKDYSKYRCYNCNKYGHWSKNCPDKESDDSCVIS